MLTRGAVARLCARALRPLARASSNGAVPLSASAEELERRYVMPTYSNDGVRATPGLVFVAGKGSKLIDQHGREYIDWAAGIAVNAIGHSDPEWAEEVAKQASKIAHISNLFHSYEPLHLAKAMVDSSKHFEKVFFCNSGTEANEAALKFARKYALVQAQKAAAGTPNATQRPAAFTAFACKSAAPTAPANCATKGGMCDCWPQVSQADIASRLRTEVVAFKHSFHGRSMGALATTHKPAIRQPFGPFAGDVKFARFNSIEDVERLVGPKTAAIIVEPVQGEGGIYPADKGFLKACRQLADQAGALLIADEVQCGLGRTGRLWAHEAYDVAPDMMTLAKPLAGGLPIGAVMVTDAVSASIQAGDHGTTYGGNPFVTRIAHLVFERIANPAFLADSRVKGARMLAGLRAIAGRHSHVVSAVRGTLDEGLFVGVELKAPPKPVTQAALKRGLIVITAGENVLRICPPLNIPNADIDEGLRLLEESIAEAYPAHATKA